MESFTFADLINQYFEDLGITAKYLSSVSGISQGVISRYRSGQRVPYSEHSDTVTALVDGIVSIAKTQGREDLTEEVVRQQVADTLRPVPNDAFAASFQKLLEALPFHAAELARSMNYDASYISKLRSGQRFPSDPDFFLQNLAEVLAEKLTGDEQRLPVCQLLGCSDQDLATSLQILQPLRSYLFGTHLSREQLNATQSLLSHIDSFDLEDYIKAIRFDELKVPSVPFLLPQQKHYYGVSGQQQAELNFLKAAVLSKGNGPVFLYSDMEMADMAEDKEFSKKWMYGLALLLKKGVKLQYVHNLNRPFDELMLGLESLIPLYMTGQIEPYYLSGVQNEVFQHIYRVSDSVALFGESIHGHHEDGRYHVTANREEVARYRRQADHILSHAHSLMDIYQEDDTESLQRFIHTIATGDYITELISSSLPPYGMATDLIKEICRDNACTEAEQKKILNYINLCEENLQQQLSAGIPLTIEIPDIREEDFARESPALNLSPLFLGRKITYSLTQYRRHRESLEKLISANELLSLTANPKAAFRNMDICISKGKWVWISKHSHPNIHFVIHYSKLREAIENMILPIYEE